MRAYFVLGSFAVLTFFLLFSSHDAHATTYDMKDQASCKSLSGTWGNYTSSCTVSNLYLSSSDSLSVDDAVFANISLTVTATLDNNGIINNSGNIVITNSAVLNNDGSIVTYCTAGCSGGTIQNEGSITNNKDGTVTVNSTITNQGSISNSGKVTINSDGTITNSAKFINTGGSIINFGTIHNNELSAIINNGGTITNYATVINDLKGTVTNAGVLTNMCNATLTSYGDLLGAPVNNTSCPKSSTVPEFPFAMLILVIGFLSAMMFTKIIK